MIDRLLQDHARMRDQMAALRVLIAQAAPPADTSALSDCRWALVREVLAHLPREDRIVYHVLEAHGSPEAKAVGRRFRAELEPLFARFQAHMERWTGPAVLADWGTYASSLAALLDDLTLRMAAEEAVLFPLAEPLQHLADPSSRRPEDRNWAADGLAIRDRIVRG